MDPALVLEPRVRAASADQRDHFLDSAESGVAHVQHFELEAVALGVARVHAEQVAGKERGFFTAGAGSDFQDYVLLVVRIARRQQLLELLFDGAEIFLQRRHLGLGQFAQVGVVAVEDGFVTGDFVGDADIFAGAMRSLGKLRSLLGELRVFPLIAERGRIGELALEFRDPLFYCACLIEHRRSAPPPRTSAKILKTKRRGRVGRADGFSPAHPGAWSTGGRRELLCYFSAAVSAVFSAGFLMPYLRLNRSTRPAVSTRRCVPV